MRTAFILLACVLLVSCSGSQKQTETPLYQGSEGLALSLPEKNTFNLYEDDIFSIAVRVENKGASHIGYPRPGWVNVMYDPASFVLTAARVDGKAYPALHEDMPRQFPFELKGRDEDVNIGELDFMDFTFKAIPVSGNRDDVQSRITFQTCYPYNTTYIANICVDRDVFNTEASKSCINHALTASSQGAPVAVTNVEQTYVRIGESVQPRFKIQLRNLQHGYLLWNSTAENTGSVCAQEDFNRKEFGRAYVQAYLSNVELECGSAPEYDGIARFDRADTEILCRLTEGIEAGSNYETPLIVRVQYFYISSLTATVEVENVAQ